jgi:carboxymethylenebutenolidase
MIELSHGRGDAMGTWIELTAADGVRVAAYRSEPVGPRRGGLVVIQEIFGVNRHIRSVCDGFAADGYLVIAPALFDRYQKGIDWGYTPDDVARGREMRDRADTEAALLDVDAAKGAAAAAGKVAVVGYCWGGLIAWYAAARVRGFACAITYYGGGMPDAVGERPHCPVLGHFGKDDPHIPLDGVEALAAEHSLVQVFTYAAGHGFNCDERDSFDAAAARLARERTLAFLHEHVG